MTTNDLLKERRPSNHPANSKNSNRIIGFDIARGIAILLMIIVNFKLAFNAYSGNSYLLTAVRFLIGKAAALFVILAGIGMSLLSKKFLVNKNKAGLQSVKKRIWKRSVFLFIIGLAYLPVWPADILHYYAFY